MDINILVAQIKRQGYTQSQSETLARQLMSVARNYGINPYELVKEIEGKIEFNDLGGFILNNTRTQGYVTGKMKKSKPNLYIQRSIFK